MKLKTHTGPVIVREMADALRAAGVAVTCEGTEHVYIEAPGDDFYRASFDTLEALRRARGTTYGLKFTGV